jgi:hypothetical protein
MSWDQVGPPFSCQDRPILFVFGAARSGTTILNNLLYRHFSYGMGPEGTFVAEWAQRLPRYGNLGDDANLERFVGDISDCQMLHIVRHKYRRNPFDVTPRMILEKLRERSYAGVVYAIFECMAEMQGCKRVGNKNPAYVSQFPLLDHLFPTQAKYLGIVRDGRDVALSIVKTRWGLSSAYSAAKFWAQSLQALADMQQQLDPERLHVITYENLLRHPRETLESVRDFLAIPPGEAEIDAAVAELTEGRRAANFDKWKKQMSETDLRLVEGLAGAMLERHGYELSGNPTAISWRDHAFYQLKESGRLLRVNLRHQLSKLS